MTFSNLPPDDKWPLTQDNAKALFDFIFAPQIKEMGLTDAVVREGFCSMRLPFNDRPKFFSGAVCGQAVMAAIDTVARMATAISPLQGSLPAPPIREPGLARRHYGAKSSWLKFENPQFTFPQRSSHWYCLISSTEPIVSS